MSAGFRAALATAPQQACEACLPTAATSGLDVAHNASMHELQRWHLLFPPLSTRHDNTRQGCGHSGAFHYDHAHTKLRQGKGTTGLPSALVYHHHRAGKMATVRSISFNASGPARSSRA